VYYNLGKNKMAKGSVIHQINIKVDQKDLALIDAKAARYGISRSAMIKLFAINGELTVDMAQSLQKPRS
jgi:hypothetical protein